MTNLQAVILGVVQGITEFLPISSSGHLIITQHLFGFKESQLVFDVFLHFASLIAIIVFFFKKLIKLKLKTFLLIGIGTIPAIFVGLFLDNYMESLFSSVKLVGFTLLLTAAINFYSSYKLKKQNKEKTKSLKKLTPKNAFIVGIFQALAIIPGISRSGSTLNGGLSQNLDRDSAFDLSFLLAIPAILGATLLQLIKLLPNNLSGFDSSTFILGGIAAFISGLVSLGFFKFILQKAKLEWFGWYCLVVGVFTLLVL